MCEAKAAMMIRPFIFFIKFERIRPVDFETRLSVWRHTFESINCGSITTKRSPNNYRQYMTSPFVGLGFGSFLTIFPFVPQNIAINFNTITEKFTHAHNDYLEFFFELGYVGLGLILAMMAFFILSFIRANKTIELVTYFSCVIAYLLNSIGNFLSQNAVSVMLLMVFYGLYRGTLKENGKTSFSR